MRAWPFALAVLPMLAGCGGGGAEQSDEAITASDNASRHDGKAACRTGGARAWARECRLERDGDMVTIRHPDGGFRRFRVLTDGRGLAEADGAEPVKLSIVGKQMIEVVVGDDRYYLPARIAGQRQ